MSTVGEDRAGIGLQFGGTLSRIIINFGVFFNDPWHVYGTCKVGGGRTWEALYCCTPGTSTPSISLCFPCCPLYLPSSVFLWLENADPAAVI